MTRDRASRRVPRTPGTAAATALLSIVCAACGLSSQTRAEASRASSSIDAENATIARKEAGYRTFAGSSAFANYRLYAEREAWGTQFDYARVKTSAARAAYTQYVAPLVRRNDKADEHAVAVQLAQIYRLINEADAYADVPQRRRGYIDDVARDYADLAKRSAEQAAGVASAMGPLLTRRDRAKSDFPARAGDIDKRIAPVQKLADAIAQATRKVSVEAANADHGRAADYVVLGDNAQLITRDADAFREDARTTVDQLDSLSKSYSKALADMKAQYFITAQRWSWNDSADSPPIHSYTYPRQELSGDAFDYFNSLPESLSYTARYSSSWFGSDFRTNSSVDAARWAALGIDPKQSWNGGDDTAEFGFTLSADYFHKYLVTDDGQTRETDWQPVDETTFESHVDDLGMDLVSKPFGTFEDEKVANPTPAGLAFVGNPQYGKWQSDDRGIPFWVWYGQYRLFSDLLGAAGQPYYYRQDEWNTWSTRYRGQPYYGEDKDKKERYGTNGYIVGSSNRYASRIPDLRHISVRHGGDGVIGRGGVHPAGK